jgi:dipeptidase E
MYILSSSGFASDALFSHCLTLLNKQPELIKVCIITTAAIPDKEQNKWILFTRDYLHTQNISGISYLDFEKDNPEILSSFDIIFIAGGNPYNLFYYIKAAKSEEHLKKIALSKDKIVIGVSAGAMLLTNGIQYISEFNRIMSFNSSKDNQINLHDMEGLKLQNLILFPHYDQFLQRNKDLENQLQFIESRDKIKIVRLNNADSICYGCIQPHLL